jgi:multidrug transporter EmrE-like cation transporter
MRAMSKSVLLLVLFSVLLSSIAQIVLKGGMSSLSVVQASQAGLGWPMVRAIAFNPSVIGGLALYFASAVVWLLVLGKLDVSLAYPFVGLGFVVTMLLAWMVHGEVLTPTRIAGTLLISVGVLVLARG